MPISTAHCAFSSTCARPKFITTTPTATAKEISRKVAINGVIAFLSRVVIVRLSSASCLYAISRLPDAPAQTALDSRGETPRILSQCPSAYWRGLGFPFAESCLYTLYETHASGDGYGLYAAPIMLFSLHQKWGW